jgi:hypothetical protein
VVRDSEKNSGGRIEISAHPLIGITILMAMIRLLTKSVWGKVMKIRRKRWSEEPCKVLHK